jgi:hypothetical protein
VKGFVLLVITKEGQGLSDRALQGEQTGNGTPKPNPDHPGASRVGKTAEAAQFEWERRERVADQPQLVDDFAGLIRRDVAEEAEGEMDLGGIGPADLVAARGGAEQGLDPGQRVCPWRIGREGDECAKRVWWRGQGWNVRLREAFAGCGWIFRGAGLHDNGDLIEAKGRDAERKAI